MKLYACGALAAAVFLSLISLAPCHAQTQPVAQEVTVAASCPSGGDAPAAEAAQANAALPEAAAVDVALVPAPSMAKSVAGAIPPWVTSLAAFCLAYEEATGELPTKMTVEALAQVRGVPVNELSLDDWGLVLNPASLANVRLDAAEYAPGDAYVRPANAAELSDLAERHPELKQDLLGNPAGPAWPVLLVRAYDPQTEGRAYETLAYNPPAAQPAPPAPQATVAAPPDPPAPEAPPAPKPAPPAPKPAPKPVPPPACSKPSGG